MSNFIDIPSVKLNDGNTIPQLGYGVGTAWFKKKGDTSTNRELIDIAKAAIQEGYYHLDAAEAYGTEKELGAAIKESKVPREKLFVTTKVNKNIRDIPNAIKTSLSNLGLDYVDLYLIHQPFYAESDQDLQRAWAELEAIQAAGLARSIGVSNFLQPHLEAVLQTAKVIPAINQIEYHPYLQNSSLLEFHKLHGITTAAYGPLTAATKAKPGPVDDYFAALARKYGVDEAEVSIRWCLDQDMVTLTTTGKAQRLKDYLRTFAFKLTPAEIKEIQDLGNKKHFRSFWKDKFSDVNDA